MLTVNVLGPIRADIDGRAVVLKGAHQRRLLGMLAAADGRVVSTDRLVDQLWVDAPPDAATKTFRTYVARLRRNLESSGAPDGAHLVVTEAPGYRLSGDVATDARVFADAVERASGRLAAGEPAAAWVVLNEALAMWSGDAFDEFAGEEWASASAIRLDELRLVARELRARAQVEAGRHTEAIAEIESFVAEHPLREAARRQLMIALYRSGRQAEALRAGRDYARFLADETGLEPSGAITEVESMIIAEDPRLDGSPHGRPLRGYLLREPIAEAGQSTIHHAVQPSIDRDVMITVISPDLADDQAFVRRFEGRAQAVAALEHPGIAPVYDYWREPGGAYLVTRHYAGGTLGARRRTTSFTAAEAWDTVTRVIDALRAAHQRGVAHGDVGLDTIWFDDRGSAVLGGFDLVTTDISHQQDLADLADLVDDLIATTSADAMSSSTLSHHRQLIALAERLRHRGESAVSVMADLLLDDGTGSGGTSSVATSVGPNPFRGLAAFTEADADLFFGRAEIVDELAETIRHRSVAALVGPSGSGKSSVVRAGLLPRYRAAGAFVATMVPGVYPLEELEIALTRIAATPLTGFAAELGSDDARLATALRSITRDPDSMLVLAIDQFEELFTLSDHAQRDRLLTAIGDALDHPAIDLRVVITCRADFIGRVLDHPTAGPLLRNRTVLLTPLSIEDLHDAIIGPAEHVGMAVEPGLVAQIVGDAAGSPGSLPMVQYVMTEVFEAGADDGVMTLADYRRLGGVTGGLAQRAEETVSALSPADQDATRRLFNRLVTVSTPSTPMRRRARRSEIATIPNDVVDAFGRARLLAFDRDPTTRDPTVEVSHEALLREWPRLAGWISEEADGLRLLDDLAAAANAWSEANDDASLLYRGNRLAAAAQWSAGHPGQLSDTESRFLAASTAAHEADIARERSRLTRLRALVTSLAVLLVVALGATGLALSASQRADDRAAEADEARAESDATRQAAEVAAVASTARVLSGSDPITAMLLAVEASARSTPDSPDVAAGLLESLSADPRATQLLAPRPSTGLVLQPASGPYYTYVSDDASVDVVDVEAGTTRSVQLDTAPGAATTDPRGEFLYAVDDDRLLLYDIDTGDLLADQPARDFFVTAPGPTADGIGDLAAAYPDGRLVVHSLPDFEVRSSVDIGPGVFAIARSGDGTIAALLDDSGSLIITPVDGSSEPQRFPRPAQTDVVAVDETGTLLALSDRSGPTYVIDLTAGEPEPLIIEASVNTSLVFSPSGRSIAVGTADGIEIFDTTTGEPLTEPIEFATGVTLQYTGERTLRAFASSLGVIALDLDAPSRVVAQIPIPDWGVAGFVAPDASGAVSIVAVEDGSMREQWFATPTAPGGADPIDIGPSLPTRDSRPIGDGRFITADIEALTHVESNGREIIQTIDLSELVAPGMESFIAPRVGKTSDILVLAEGGEAVRRSQVVVIDRIAGEADVRVDATGITVAEFADLNEGVIAVGDINGDVRWINPGSGEQPDTVTVGASIGAIAAMPDGSRTAIGDWSGTITVVDADRSPIAELDNDAPFPIRMAFVADGARLIVQSEDGSIVLWDVDSATRIGTLHRTAGLRGAFEVAADGRTVLVADDRGLLEISIDPDNWVTLACRSVDRSLTEAELQSVVPGVEMIDDPCAAEG